MEVSSLIDILMHGNQLKRTVRTGWAQRGVPNPENVAAHSYGVAYVALVLAELIDDPIDLAAVLAMAVVHDLPESLTTDIPSPAWRYLPDGSKAAAERRAMKHITGETPAGLSLQAWWEKLQRTDLPEVWLLHDADKLDQYLQAYVYEHQTGNRHLQEFWSTPHRFHFAAAQAIYDEVRSRRDGSLTVT